MLCLIAEPTNSSGISTKLARVWISGTANQLVSRHASGGYIGKPSGILSMKTSILPIFPRTMPCGTRYFSNIASTSALFLALEPQVFVSKIRCRIFRHWRAAEAYYVNTLRQLKRQLATGGKAEPTNVEVDLDLDEDEIAAKPVN